MKYARTLPRSRSAFAMITGLLLIAIVAVTVAGLSTLLAADAQRTRRENAEAQVRQFLLAGATDAVVRAAAWDRVPGARAWEMTVPSRPGDPPAAVSCRINSEASSTSMDVVMQAAVGPSHASQTLHFVQSAGHWELKRIQLTSGSWNPALPG